MNSGSHALMDHLPIILVPHPHVRVDKKVMGGSPHVAGSRVPVRRLWQFYRTGTEVEVLIRRFPKLGAVKIFDALAFAFDNKEVMEIDMAREEQMLAVQGEIALTAERKMALPFKSQSYDE